jgi:N-acetylmuramoyl-L-alanine amidase
MRICIDPGHGGYDPGACGNGLREADLNLSIAKCVERTLTAAGHTVLMTRTSDCSPKGYTDKSKELQARVDMSDAFKADLFISIHVNAGGGHGAEIIVNKKGNFATPIATRVIENVGAIMGYHGTPVKDLAELGRSLYVVKATKAPAMLVEVGFIDTDDAHKITQNIEAIGRAIAEGLVGSCEIKPVVPPTPAPTPTPVLVDTKTQAFNEAKQLGIIKSDEWLAKLNDPAPVWFVLIVVLNAIKYVTGGKR